MKNNLIKLGFIDNEWLDKYCILIESNKDTKKEKYKTQSHHIIPRCYFTLNNLKCDNSKENLVNLSYKDHILAHYYICFCLEGNLRYKLANAFCHLVFKKYNYDNFNPSLDDNKWEELYDLYIKNLTIRKGIPNLKLRGLKHPKSVETKLKISNSMKGKLKGNTYAKGKKWKDDSKKKLSNSKKGLELSCNWKPILCVELNKEFPSLTKAMEWLGKGDIPGCLRGRQSIAGGYHWKYLKK